MEIAFPFPLVLFAPHRVRDVGKERGEELAQLFGLPVLQGIDYILYPTVYAFPLGLEVIGSD